MARRNGGFIGIDGLDAPDPPTAITPTAGNTQVSVAFTAPTDAGTSAITGFVAQVSTDGTDYSAGSNTGTSSPIVVSSLTNGTAATAKVWAINAYGTSSPSDASASFTPALSIAIFNGYDGSTETMEQIDFSTRGNSTSFGGDLSQAKLHNSFWGSATRAVSAGGYAGGNNIDTVEYFTFASASNAADFGNLSDARRFTGALANNTRGIVGGGFTAQNTIEYFTTASTGNATDFGDLTVARYYASGVSSPTRGLFMGGDD